MDTPLSGFVLNSENGEEQFLSEDERLDVVRTVNNARSGQKFIIGGVDSSSVTDSIRTAEALVEAEVEAFIDLTVAVVADTVADLRGLLAAATAAPPL